MLRITPYHQVALLVFIFFLFLFLIINFSATPLASPDDTYYHIKHAQTYWSGEKMNMPVFSSLDYPGADLYLGYHLLLAPFTFAFNGSNYTALLAGSKIFHSIAVALIFTTFYLIARQLLQDHTKQNYAAYFSFLALAGTFFLFIGSLNFTNRLLFQRPHVISITLLLLGFYFTIKKKYRWLFLVSASFPLLYSVSFIILIPPLIYAICWHLYNRTWHLAKQAYFPLIVTLLGLALGILLHPDSLHYLYNAYYVHLLAIINLYLHATIEGSELYAARKLHIELLWLIPYLTILSYVTYGYFMDKKFPRIITFTFEKFYLSALTLFFFILAIIIQRAIEYLIPFVSLFLVWVTSEDLLPVIKKKYLLSMRAIFIIATSAYFIFVATHFIWQTKSLPPYDRYKNAARFIQENSAPGSIIFTQAFSNYPQLVFFNNYNRYVMGMGSIFTYVNRPDLYWLYHHIIKQGKACPQKNCGPADFISAHEAINNYFNAKFVFYDASNVINELGDKEFLRDLEHDPRFKKIFTDKNFPEISVYAL